MIIENPKRPKIAPEAPTPTSFTYQGELKVQNVPGNSSADMRFRLYDASLGGTQIGPMIQPQAAAIVNGRFTSQLDFGSGVFNGDARWLEIDVRVPAGGGVWTKLSPRTLLAAVPYALYALNASSVAGPTGPPSDQSIRQLGGGVTLTMWESIFATTTWEGGRLKGAPRHPRRVS